MSQMVVNEYYPSCRVDLLTAMGTLWNIDIHKEMIKAWPMSMESCRVVERIDRLLIDQDKGISDASNTAIRH